MSRDICYCCFSVTKHMHASTCAHTCTRTHTHTPHVLVNTHALNVSRIHNFQELSVNQGVNVKEFLHTTKDFIFV